MEQPTTIDFWFDPICPFTWVTSRWVADVAERRGLTVHWKPFSLKVLNSTPEAEDTDEAHGHGHRMGRVIVRTLHAQGVESVAALYAALGERIHPAGRDDFDVVIAESLAEAGLPADLADAADDPQFDAELVESTNQALEKTGRGVGIPIIGLDGRAFFGPVFTRRPEGEQALELWDAFAALTSYEHFFELKRQITGRLEF